VTAVLLLGFVALMLAGVPVALAMIVASLAYVMLSGTIPDFVVIHRMYGGLDSFPLLAVPFFILAGNLMNSAGSPTASTTSRSRWSAGCAAAWAT